MAACHSSRDALCVNEEYCIICQKGFESERSIKVTEKGLQSLILYSENRRKLNLHQYLKEYMSAVPNRKVLVHGNVAETLLMQNVSLLEVLVQFPVSPQLCKRLRSDSLPFDWK